MSCGVVMPMDELHKHVVLCKEQWKSPHMHKHAVTSHARLLFTIIISMQCHGFLLFTTHSEDEETKLAYLSTKSDTWAMQPFLDVTSPIYEDFNVQVTLHIQE